MKPQKITVNATSLVRVVYPLLSKSSVLKERSSLNAAKKSTREYNLPRNSKGVTKVKDNKKVKDNEKVKDNVTWCKSGLSAPPRREKKQRGRESSSREKTKTRRQEPVVRSRPPPP